MVHNYTVWSCWLNAGTVNLSKSNIKYIALSCLIISPRERCLKKEVKSPYVQTKFRQVLFLSITSHALLFCKLKISYRDCIFIQKRARKINFGIKKKNSTGNQVCALISLLLSFNASTFWAAVLWPTGLNWSQLFIHSLRPNVRHYATVTLMFSGLALPKQQSYILKAFSSGFSVKYHSDVAVLLSCTDIWTFNSANKLSSFLSWLFILLQEYQ